MRTEVTEVDEKVRVQFELSCRRYIGLRHPTTDSIRIELIVPRAVKGVGEIYATAISADLNHLRSAVQSLLREFRMSSAAHYSTQLNRAGERCVEGIGNIILAQFACPPAR